MIGNGGLDSGPVMGVGAPIFGSMDFKKWYRIGASELIVGDCPTFMPLPPLTAGSDAALDAQQLASLPSHAHKSGSGDPTAQYPGAPARNRHDDTVEIGSWEDGPVNTTGSWTPCCQRRRLVDAGEMHASKDFWDPVKRRRILWGWGTLGTGFQTLPREVTFDPRLAGGQLVYTPARELAQLRSTEPLAALGKTSLHPGAPPLKLKSGPASEIEVVFGRPSNAANL
jgi:beta-fructofuranosidase